MPIKVKINQGNQQSVVHNTTTFVGSGSYVAQIATALQIANTALYNANSAYQATLELANTKYDKTGGLISGNVRISETLVTNYFNANNLIVDAGTF
jgi:hypothetical protein